MTKILGFVMSIASVMLIIASAYNFPSFTVGTLDFVVGAVKTATYILPSPWGAVAEVSMRLLIPGFFLISINAFLVWAAVATGHGAKNAYGRVRGERNREP